MTEQAAFDGVELQSSKPDSRLPSATTSFNIGGFSDAVFNVVASYLGDDAGRFVAEVESVEL